MRLLVRARAMTLVLVCLMLSIAPSDISYAVGVPFRGADDDHFWDMSVVYCRDAVRIAADEIPHSPPPADPDLIWGDHKAFSLVLTQTTALLGQGLTLPKKIATSDGIMPRELVHATVAYPYATAKQPGTALGITLERWEHGAESTIEPDPIGGGDSSGDDDVQVINGTVANCTAATAPHFDSPPTAPSGQVVLLTPGSAFSHSLQASDDDAYDTTVTFNVTGLPAGATLSPNLTGNPASTTLNWTPSAGQIGLYTITITAQDPTGRISSAHTVTISVSTSGGSTFLPLIQH